jgi:hypothetical protein
MTILKMFGEFVSSLCHCITGGLNFPYRYDRTTAIESVTRPLELSVPGIIWSLTRIGSRRRFV